LGNVERTHPQPPDPQSERGTLATHSRERARKGKEGKGSYRKGTEGKGRERTGKEGKEGKGKERLIWKSAAVA